MKPLFMLVLLVPLVLRAESIVTTNAYPGQAMRGWYAAHVGPVPESPAERDALYVLYRDRTGPVRIDLLYHGQHPTAAEIDGWFPTTDAEQPESAPAEMLNGIVAPFVAILDDDGKLWFEAVVDGQRVYFDPPIVPTKAEQRAMAREQHQWITGLQSDWRTNRFYYAENAKGWGALQISATATVSRATALSTTSTTAAAQQAQIEELRKLVLQLARDQRDAAALGRNEAQESRKLAKGVLDYSKGWLNTNAPPEAP